MLLKNHHHRHHQKGLRHFHKQLFLLFLLAHNSEGAVILVMSTYHMRLDVVNLKKCNGDKSILQRLKRTHLHRHYCYRFVQVNYLVGCFHRLYLKLSTAQRLPNVLNLPIQPRLLDFFHIPLSEVDLNSPIKQTKTNDVNTNLKEVKLLKNNIMFFREPMLS